MPRFVPVEELFKGRHFDQEIVVLCVRWYLSFKLSYRDLVAIMGERGIFWHIRRSCGGCSITPRSSRNDGDAMPGRWVAPGGVTKPRMVKIFMRRGCSTGVSRQGVLDSGCHDRRPGLS